MLARLTVIITVLTTIIGLLGGFRWLFNEWSLWRNRRATRWIVALGLVLASAGPVLAQNHQTFTMIRPVATGSAGTGLDADNRVYRAYQGLTYTIHADAIGGHWPYTYSLSNAPSGMTIEAGPCTDIGPDCTAGTITWTNPQSTASDIVVTVTDKDGDTVTGTWTVTVSTTIGADGFCFLSGTGNDTTGDGSLSTPWATLAKARTSCGARSILILRAGTYVVTGMTETTPTDCGRQVAWSEASHPVVWLAYPGESPVIEFGSDGGAAVPCMEMTGQNIWLDGFTMQNIGSIGFQFIRSDNYGIVARNLTATGLLDGEGSANSAFLMWNAHYNGPTASYYDTVQNSTFTTVTGDGAGSDDGCAVKIYSVRSGLFETSTYSDSAFSEAILALKAEVPGFTVRANKFLSDVTTGIGGNMDNSPNSGLADTGGEIYHNLCLGSGTTSEDGCLTIGVANTSGDLIAAIWAYRNTFLGLVNVTGSGVEVEGPYTFTDNVILNAGGTGGDCPAYITCHSVPDYSRIVMSSNVTGANNGTIANATTGLLVGDSRTSYLGLDGFEFGESQVPSSPMGMFLMEAAGGFVTALHVLFACGAAWQRRSSAAEAAFRFWRYASEKPKELYWRVAYRRAVKRWQRAAPLMLPAPVETMTLHESKEARWR